MKEVHDNHCQCNSRFLHRCHFLNIWQQTRQLIGRVKFDLKHSQSVACSSRLILLYIFFFFKVGFVSVFCKLRSFQWLRKNWSVWYPWKNKLQQILCYLLAGSCLYLGKTVPEVLSTSWPRWTNNRCYGLQHLMTTPVISAKALFWKHCGATGT